jgi:hypothetical protein
MNTANVYKNYIEIVEIKAEENLKDEESKAAAKAEVTH